jgi:hypothetical protein
MKIVVAQPFSIYVLEISAKQFITIVTTKYSQSLAAGVRVFFT